MYNTQGLDNKKYRSKLRCHTKFYRSKLTINKDSIRNKWWSLLNENPNSIVELGFFRHHNTYCNYDYVIDLITNKWEEEDPIFSRDLVHSTQNYCNTILLKEIMLADREYQKLTQEN